jgi:hypothetical protein
MTRKVRQSQCKEFSIALRAEIVDNDGTIVYQSPTQIAWYSWKTTVGQMVSGFKFPNGPYVGQMGVQCFDSPNVFSGYSPVPLTHNMSAFFKHSMMKYGSLSVLIQFVDNASDLTHRIQNLSAKVKKLRPSGRYSLVNAKRLGYHCSTNAGCNLFN